MNQDIIEQRALVDGQNWRRRNRTTEDVSERVLKNHFGLSRDLGHLGPITPDEAPDALSVYAKQFRASAASDREVV